MERRAEKVDTVPAVRSFVDHTFLDSRYTAPGRWIGPRLPDILATIARTGEALISDPLAGLTAIGTGMAEAAIDHIPAMQKRT